MPWPWMQALRRSDAQDAAAAAGVQPVMAALHIRASVLSRRCSPGVVGVHCGTHIGIVTFTLPKVLVEWLCDEISEPPGFVESWICFMSSVARLVGRRRGCGCSTVHLTIARQRAAVA